MVAAAVRAQSRGAGEALGLVEADVREMVRRQGLDPLGDAEQVRELIRTAVREYEEKAAVSVLPPLGETEEAQRRLDDAITGFGPLQPYLDDPMVEEIWINPPADHITPSQTWITRAAVRPQSARPQLSTGPRPSIRPCAATLARAMLSSIRCP